MKPFNLFPFTVIHDECFPVCHHNSLLIYGSLRTPTLDRFAKVTHISTLISLVACCTLAISAYVVFTDKTQGNILNNFSLVISSSLDIERVDTYALTFPSFVERYINQCCTVLLRAKYVYNTSTGAVCMQGGGFFVLCGPHAILTLI